MLAVQSDFDNGRSEVDSYFAFLNTVDQDYTRLTNAAGTAGMVIDSELVKILKANAFLLLYNLIEATLRNGLWEIHTTIQSEGVDYENLAKHLKNILVNNQVRARFEFGTRTESVTTTVYEIIEKILYDTTTLHPAEKVYLKFSAGNLDISTIDDTFKDYGISAVPITHTDQKDAFVNTKRNRNNLAHGNKSFNECGKDYTFTQLNGFKSYIFDYLQRVLDAIDNFIVAKSYKKPPVTASTSRTT